MRRRADDAGSKGGTRRRPCTLPDRASSGPRRRVATLRLAELPKAPIAAVPAPRSSPPSGRRRDLGQQSMSA